MLAFRYLEGELLTKALGTQKSELDSLKLFYDFWFIKFSVTLDYSLYRSNFQNVLAIVSELDAFWDYLLAGKQITNVIALPKNNYIKELNKRRRTASKRCVDICRFVKFLSNTYLTPNYSPDNFLDLKRTQAAIDARIDEMREKFHRFSSASKKISASDTLRSMTSEQFNDFIKIIMPDTVKPNQSNPRAFTVIKPNSLNPMVSFDIQMRNYLITILMVKYGLRVGESLLLHKKSFLPFRSDKNVYLMRVRNLEDDHEDIDDLRTHKPSIKTRDSIRDIEITSQHYKQIMVYFEYIRPENCDHDYIFSSHKSPYKPLSYSTYLIEFSAFVSSFKRNFPEHFDPLFAESIEDDITTHWLRHTWAYGTLSTIYDKVKGEYSFSDAINIKGLMDDAIDKLRLLGGWSKKSRMPQKYAKRFIQEEANRTLLNVFYSNQDKTIIEELEKEDWDAAFK